MNHDRLGFYICTDVMMFEFNIKSEKIFHLFSMVMFHLINHGDEMIIKMLLNNHGIFSYYMIILIHIHLIDELFKACGLDQFIKVSLVDIGISYSLIFCIGINELDVTSKWPGYDSNDSCDNGNDKDPYRKISWV